MLVSGFGLVFKPISDFRLIEIPLQLVYIDGHSHPGGFHVEYVGETARGYHRFQDDHKGLQRSRRNGSTSLLIAPVYGAARRKAVETLIRYEHIPGANDQPRPSFNDYLDARSIWFGPPRLRDLPRRTVPNAFARPLGNALGPTHRAGLRPPTPARNALGTNLMASLLLRASEED